MKISVDAYAKINLTLEILNRREDGYHNVDMVMQSISLCDTVWVEKRDDKRITVNCNKFIVDSLENNTAYKAAELFFEASRIINSGVHIEIEKRIPMQAGLAGGSADAAGVLVAMNRLFNVGLTAEQLMKIGEKIGADVPFCVHGGTMHALGTGTRLIEVDNMPKCYILVAKPDVGISTAQAYTKSDEQGFLNRNCSDKIIEAIKNESLIDVSKNLFNRFEQVLDLQEIEQIKNQMISCGAYNSCMSGSGSAVFGIFSSEDEANMCANRLKIAYKDVFVCTTKNIGCKIN